MEIEFLIKSFGTLTLLLGLLLYFLLSNSKKKKTLQREAKKKKERQAYPTLESLADRVKDKQTSTQDLLETIDDILKYYGTIHPKLGTRTHPDFKIYGFIMLKICQHPNTNKQIILKFDRELREKNPEYSREINDFLTKGLELRG